MVNDNRASPIETSLWNMIQERLVAMTLWPVCLCGGFDGSKKGKNELEEKNKKKEREEEEEERQMKREQP